MNIKKRLERLEEEYFPDLKREGAYLWEWEFSSAFEKEYEGREYSAPPILRRGYQRLCPSSAALWRRSEKPPANREGEAGKGKGKRGRPQQKTTKSPRFSSPAAMSSPIPKRVLREGARERKEEEKP